MAQIGYELALYVSDAFPATTAVKLLGQITDLNPPNPSREIIDITSSSSPNMAREFMPGMIDYGEFNFEMNWDPGSTTDVLLRGLALERNPRTWRIVYAQMTPDAPQQFQGFLTAYERTSPISEKMVATVTVKVTGPVSYT